MAGATFLQTYARSWLKMKSSLQEAAYMWHSFTLQNGNVDYEFLFVHQAFLICQLDRSRTKWSSQITCLGQPILYSTISYAVHSCFMQISGLSPFWDQSAAINRKNGFTNSQEGAGGLDVSRIRILADTPRLHLHAVTRFALVFCRKLWPHTNNQQSLQLSPAWSWCLLSSYSQHLA